MTKQELIKSLKADLKEIDYKLDVTYTRSKNSVTILELVQAKRLTIKSLIELDAYEETA